MADEPTEHTDEQPEPVEPTPEASAAETPAAPEESVAQPPAEEPAAEEAAPEEAAPAEEPIGEAPPEEQPVAESEPEAPAVSEPVAAAAAASEEAADSDEEEAPTPRVKPSVPGAHLEVDIVPEGVDPLAPEQPSDPYAIEEDEEPQAEEETESEPLSEPIATAAIDLASGARYKATGKRKTAIARVILRPGSGAYLVNGKALDEHFPRVTLQRNIRQPLETVGYQDRMDVVARLHGGGISAQAGALRHGISRALLEADPNLRGELKRRGFLTRDSRAKERKKAGLKKARKRPQFSKR